MKTSSPAPVRVLLVWCPQWSIRAVREQAAPGAALLLIAKGMVVACSPAAAAAGVTTGLRVREAQLRCPDAAVLPHDPAVESREFEPVLRAIEEVVPGVHTIRPGLAAVRAGGARRFYGSEHLAAQAILHGVQDRLGGDLRVAVADGLFAAEQAAYTTTAESPLVLVHPGASRRFLAQLPVSTLEREVDSTRMPGLLRRMGIRRLSELADLRRAEVHARFGPDGLRAHQLASGEDAPVLDVRSAPKDLTVRIDLEDHVTQVDQVTDLCIAGVDRFVQHLIEQALLCHEIRVILDLESGATDTRVWRHPWHFSAADVLDRVRWQLQDLASDDEPLTHAITGVSVVPESVDPALHHATGLWGDRPDEHVVQALTGLQKTLGRGGVLTCAVRGGRLLDERRVLRPWGDALPTPRERRLEQPWPGNLPGPPPATVFTRARPVSVLTEIDQPVTVSPRGEVSGAPAWLRLPEDRPDTRRITAWAGPWPVQQRWWQATGRGPLDRFQLLDEREQAWLVLSEAGHWWAEARYD
ncbi:DNA polymerase Y family protein [Leekyejoonella antrihumi]|nr:DNA polymerase Y family protein [Leekyejoonella antrihumi]